MKILLVRPAAPERFGLGPFFRTEPLGLEYVAAACRRAGHDPEILDLRAERRTLGSVLRRAKPAVVGISCIHTIDVPGSRDLAREVRRALPAARVVVGGRGAAASTEAFAGLADAVCEGAGERVFPELLRALEKGAEPHAVEGFCAPGDQPVRRGESYGMDPDLMPARDLVERARPRYRCVHRSPVWALETGRGCPFRCSFCAVGRSGGAALRSVDAVCRDFLDVGRDVFVVDDLFFHPRERSQELARQLARRGMKKSWLLVQTRTDLVARHPEHLEEWRPLADKFDLFLGFEAASDEGLERLRKDATLADSERAVEVARSMGFGVTGNFVIDPDWTEADFERLWATTERLRLDRVGFTVLTPLPGTKYFEETRASLVETDLGRWDMHHLLYEPRLGRRRFYELVVKSWKLNVLSSRHASRRWLKWFSGLGVRDAFALAGVLWRTQRLLDVDAYLEDTFTSFPAMPSERATDRASSGASSPDAGNASRAVALRR